MKKNTLPFDPEIFLAATNHIALDSKSSLTDYSCNAIISVRHEFPVGQHIEALHFYESLFGINQYHSVFFVDFTTGQYQAGTTVELRQGTRFCCLYLAYLIAKDIQSGKISPLFA